nr:hypothetical protein [Chrysanthemum yellow edge associated virus 1]
MSGDRIERISIELKELHQQHDTVLQKINLLEKTLVSKSTPHPFFTKRDENLECYCHENGTFPHLFHTENPQLNNISDLLVFIIRNNYIHNQREKTILDNLEKTNEKISQLLQNDINDTTLSQLENLNKDLQNILKLQEHKQLVTPPKPITIGPPPSYGRPGI